MKEKNFFGTQSLFLADRRLMGLKLELYVLVINSLTTRGLWSKERQKGSPASREALQPSPPQTLPPPGTVPGSPLDLQP